LGFHIKKAANMTLQNTVIPTAGFTYNPDSGLAIEARNVNKIYDAGGRPHHALKSIDIEVPIGCIFGLLGPNGAGKCRLKLHQSQSRYRLAKMDRAG